MLTYVVQAVHKQAVRACRCRREGLDALDATHMWMDVNKSLKKKKEKKERKLSRKLLVLITDYAFIFICMCVGVGVDVRMCVCMHVCILFAPQSLCYLHANADVHTYIRTERERERERAGGERERDREADASGTLETAQGIPAGPLARMNAGSHSLPFPTPPTLTSTCQTKKQAAQTPHRDVTHATVIPGRQGIHEDARNGLERNQTTPQRSAQQR